MICWPWPRLSSARQPAPPAAPVGDALDLVERDQQCAHARKPGLRRLLEACRYDISELGREWSVRALDRWDRSREMHHTQRAQIVMVERRMAGEQLEQHRAEAVLIRSVGRREAAQLLGRDVR